MIRLAYLNTQYPSLSHTFVEREVRAVRKQGIDVHTFSVRCPSASGALGEAHRAAAQETHYLLATPLRLLWTQLRALLCRPLAWFRVLVGSQRLSPPGAKARLRHLVYAAEAVALACEMRRRGLQHVHVHMANNGAAVALLATRFDRRISYSLSIHGSAEFFHVDSWRLREKAEAAAFVRCISDFCRAQVMAWTCPSAWRRFHVVHCGIDTDSFAPRPPQTEGPLRLLTVGRLDPIKGYSVLLEACCALSGDGIDWRLDMVGDGPMRAAIARQVSDLGLGERVTLHGAVGQDDIQRHFERADVLVVSSFMEGVPVVLMEAMAKQLAVVATRVGGIPELIEDGVTGLLVAPGSVGSLAAALLRLADSDEFAGRMGPPAREKVIAEFTVDKLGVAMAGLFRTYCGGRSAAARGAAEPVSARLQQPGGGTSQ